MRLSYIQIALHDKRVLRGFNYMNNINISLIQAERECNND
nr:MAG TPA: hypothetical protein [Bacteriophage sp.]